MRECYKVHSPTLTTILNRRETFAERFFLETKIAAKNTVVHWSKKRTSRRRKNLQYQLEKEVISSVKYDSVVGVIINYFNIYLGKVEWYSVEILY